MTRTDAVEKLAQAALFVKDTQLLVIFMEMFKAEWLAGFAASPAALVVKPLLTLTLLVLAGLQVYRLLHAPKRTLQLYLTTFMTVAGAALSTSSLIGGILVVFMGLAFTAGPTLFLSSMVTGFLLQAGLALWYAHRAFKASDQKIRMQHVQAVVAHALAATQIGICILAIVFTLFAPISAPASAALSVLAVSMIFGLMCWRLLPQEYKETIKGWLGFAEPEASPEYTKEPPVDRPAPTKQPESPSQASRSGPFFPPAPPPPAPAGLNTGVVPTVG